MKFKKLKILFIAGWYPKDERAVNAIFIKEHAKAVALKHEVVVINAYQRKLDYKKIYIIESDKYEEGIRTVRISYGVIIPKTSWMVYMLVIISAFLKLRREGFRPDLIHGHIYITAFPIYVLKKIFKIPTVLTEHTSRFPLKTLSKGEIIRIKVAFRNLDYIIPVSNSLRLAIERYGIKANFRIVPNTVNEKIFKVKRENSDVCIKNERITSILFVGLLTPVKGVSYLISAIEKIVIERDDFILNIIGDGPSKQKYEAIVKNKNLAQNIKFLGLKNKDEIAKYMRGSEFLILPSITENMPCVLLEALCSGLPIIASNVGGIPEIINRENGILTQPKNVNELIRAITNMLDNNHYYDPIIISTNATKNFSYKAICDRFTKIYDECFLN